MRKHVTFIHSFILSFIHSFIHSYTHPGYSYSAPSRNVLRSALSPATAKEKCITKLAEGADIATLEESCFRVEGTITEKARRCLSAEPARGTKSSPRAEERRARWEAKSETGEQWSIK